MHEPYRMNDKAFQRWYRHAHHHAIRPETYAIAAMHLRIETRPCPRSVHARWLSGIAAHYAVNWFHQCGVPACEQA